MVLFSAAALGPSRPSSDCKNDQYFRNICIVLHQPMHGGPARLYPHNRATVVTASSALLAEIASLDRENSIFIIYFSGISPRQWSGLA